MLDFVGNAEQFEGANVATVEFELSRYGAEAGWRRVATKNGPMWVSPDERYQLRLSNAHEDGWRLYAQLRGVPRSQMELGRAYLKGDLP